MKERTPEYWQIDAIIANAISDLSLYGCDDGVDVSSTCIAALAAPLEAANKRVRELERELGERKLEDHLDTASTQKQNAELREAVRVLAKNLAEYAMCRHVNGNEWINCASDEVNANPTARSAIEAAAKETKQ
jgi:hypothetical protein